MFLLIAIVFGLEARALYGSAISSVWGLHSDQFDTIKVLQGFFAASTVLYLAFGLVWGYYEMREITPEPLRYMILIMGGSHALAINYTNLIIDSHILKLPQRNIAERNSSVVSKPTS